MTEVSNKRLLKSDILRVSENSADLADCKSRGPSVSQHSSQPRALLVSGYLSSLFFR